MFTLLDKIFSKFSIKNIIYLGLASMAISIILISVLFFYVSTSLQKSESTIKDIIEIKVQTNNILKSLQSTSEVEMKIVLAKELEEFDVIDSIEFDELTFIEKINLRSDIDIKKYNDILNKLKDLLSKHIQIKEDMSSYSYSIISYEYGLLESLVLIEKEMIAINNLTELLSGKIKLRNKRNNRKLTKILKKDESKIKEIVPRVLEVLVGNIDKLNRKINELQKTVLGLIVISREINLSKNKDTINDLETNRMLQSRILLEKGISELLNSLKDPKLKDIIFKMSSHIIRINELQDSLISLKKFSFFQKENLATLLKDRNSVNSEIIKNVEILSNIAKTISDKIVASFERTSKQTFIFTLIILISIIFFLFTFGWILLSRINKPLYNLTRTIETISPEKNNLHENLEVEYNDEFKKLVNAFNKMTSSLANNIKELKESEKEISILNADLEKRVELRTKQLSEKNQKISDLFNHAKQGFLSFDNDLIVDDEYSLECTKLLGENIEGKIVCDLFYSEDNNKKEFFKQTFLDILNEENEIVKKSYIELLPKEFILNRRAIKIDYIQLENNKIMLVLTNITAQKKLEKKVKEEQQILKMIVTIVSDSNQFYEIMEDFNIFNKNRLDIFKLNNSALFNLSETYREIHTFKGLFAQLYMQNIVKKLHSFETSISECIEDKSFKNDDLKTLLEENDFISWLEEDLEIINTILGETFLKEESVIKINEKSIIKLEEKIKDYCSLDKKNADNYEDILYSTQKLRSRTLSQSLQNYPRVCSDLSEKLGKEIYPFQILGDETITLPINFKLFVKSLIHVFRNLIDHGIEVADERIELGKNEKGTIVCNFKLEDNSLIIMISDDGRGISREKIKQKVVENEILSSEEFDKMSDERVFGFIFYESFSTSDKITDTSGRGIGLSAVKNELVKIKGEIEVKSVLNEGTTFIFKLPYKRERARNV